MSKVQDMFALAAEKYVQIQPGLQKTGEVLKIIGKCLWFMRSIFLAIPIVLLSIYLARLNNNLLPELVGIGLQNNGEFARMIPRETAVYGPMAITAASLLMVLLSRKTLYPWLISLFSLVLPLVILIINIFPG